MSRTSQIGLCATCAHARIIENRRGSQFWRCAMSDNDPRFPRYPRLPVVRYQGYTKSASAPQPGPTSTSSTD